MTFLKLKPLTLDHLSAVVELDHLCFGGLWTRSGYEREIESPCSQLLILEAASDLGESGQQTALSGVEAGLIVTPEMEISPTAPTLPNALIGLGCYWSILEEAHITILAVHPDYQRQGLGQLLLYALLRDAVKHTLAWVTLEVKPSNQAALSVYQKFGFTEVGRRRNYYKDTGEDALILWRGGLQTPSFEETLTDSYRQATQRLQCCGWQLSALWGLENGTRS